LSGPPAGVVLAPPLLDRAVAAACAIADRLRDPVAVRATVEAMPRQMRAPGDPSGALSPWGLARRARLFLTLRDAVDERDWEEPARRHLRLAAEASQDAPLTRPALFGGTAGFALVLESFQRAEPGYRTARDAVLGRLAEQVLAREWRPRAGVADDEYDVISGASGIVACLVSVDSLGARAEAALRVLLDYLVGLADTDQTRERWFVPPPHYKHAEQHDLFPNGYVDLGLAHGLPGPLAALSLAWEAGHRVDGQRAAIERMSAWLLGRRRPDPWGWHWPSQVGVGASRPEAEEPLPTRSAWCYGDPGVAAALWLAGRATGDERLCERATQAMEAVLQRPAEVRRVFSPTLCHGLAGVLAICLRFAEGAASPRIHSAVAEHAEQVLGRCDPGLPLGVRDEDVPGNLVDDPSFVTGADGVATALLAAAVPEARSWDRTLLIA
jgi:lantibiotic biosynthesis protein